jgi:hypothetical protein
MRADRPTPKALSGAPPHQRIKEPRLPAIPASPAATAAVNQSNPNKASGFSRCPGAGSISGNSGKNSRYEAKLRLFWARAKVMTSLSVLSPARQEPEQHQLAKVIDNDEKAVRKVSMLFMSAELKQNQLNSTSCLVKKNLLNDSKTPAIMKCFCYSECCHACAVPRT